LIRLRKSDFARKGTGRAAAARSPNAANGSARRARRDIPYDVCEAATDQDCTLTAIPIECTVIVVPFVILLRARAFMPSIGSLSCCMIHPYQVNQLADHQRAPIKISAVKGGGVRGAVQNNAPSGPLDNYRLAVQSI
jgi:hypothetical protein